MLDIHALLTTSIDEAAVAAAATIAVGRIQGAVPQGAASHRLRGPGRMQRRSRRDEGSIGARDDQPD